MLFPRWIWFLLGHCYAVLLYMDSCRVRAMPMSVAKVVYSHAGLCPNDLNPNLWVDAMSTCMRECESDQVSSAVMFAAECEVCVQWGTDHIAKLALVVTK